MNADFLSSVLCARGRDSARSALNAVLIAERELAAAYGEPRSEPRWLFVALMRPSSMFGLVDDIYTAHVRELIARAREGGDLTLATRAEVLAYCTHASAVVPMGRAFASMYQRLAAEIVPGVPADGVTPEDPDWVTDVASWQRRLRVAGRGLGDARRRSA